MPAERSENAVLLYKFLQSECDRMGVKITTWCRQHGLADATVLRWREGVEPDMRSLKRVAVALHRPLWEVLLGAGYITAEQVGREVDPRVYDVREAIDLDRKLSERTREALRQVYDLAVTSGEVAEHGAPSRRTRGRPSRFFRDTLAVL